MLTYKSAFVAVSEGIHVGVLDFPGVITWGRSLEEAHRSLASALVDMAEASLLRGEPLTQPDPTYMDPDADLEEPIHLIIKASSRVVLVSQELSTLSTPRASCAEEF